MTADPLQYKAMQDTFKRLQEQNAKKTRGERWAEEDRDRKPRGKRRKL